MLSIMQDRKEYIVERAFEVFISKGYDSASMTVLHKELGISRGAMYRYFKSKDDLFIAVVDKYVFGMLNNCHPQFDEETSIRKRIDELFRNLILLGEYLDGIENMQVKFLNFTALMIQAAKIYPDFIEKVQNGRRRSFREWKKVVEYGVRSGELREDVNPEIVAQFFCKMLNFINSEEMSKGFAEGVKSGKKQINYFYSMIKK